MFTNSHWFILSESAILTNKRWPMHFLFSQYSLGSCQTCSLYKLRINQNTKIYLLYIKKDINLNKNNDWQFRSHSQRVNIPWDVSWNLFTVPMVYCCLANKHCPPCMIQGNDAYTKAKYVLTHRLLMTRSTTQSTPLEFSKESLYFIRIEIHEHSALV